MNTWKVILATLVIFGSGVVTGGLLVTHTERAKQRQLWMLNRTEKPRVNRPEVRVAMPNPGMINPPEGNSAPSNPVLPAVLRLDLLQRIERQINLTAGQREKIEEILREGQEQSRQIMEPVQAELQKQMRSTRERIRAVLTEEQQARFDELLRPQRRFEEPLPGERRMQRPQFRQQEGPARFPGPGPRPAESGNPAP